jgi:homocysteine S-methyltransferase
VLALETVPCLAEGEALLAELGAIGVPAWLSFTCKGDRLRSGEPAADAFGLARGVPDVLAVGVNCTDPADAARLVPVAAAATGLPVVVYPNSGERWDAGRKRWSGAAAFDPAAVRRWLAGGARLVGGCCRVGPAEIAGVAAVVAGVGGSAGASSG